MKQKHTMATFCLGVLAGAALFGGGAAVAAGVVAEPGWQPIYVDGKQVSMTAYNIAGNNYVKLRDIGEAVGFNVYWENGVQVDSNAPYTGTAPDSMPKPESKPEVKPADTASSVDVEAARQEIAELTNQYRANNGVAALRVDDKLMQAAQVRAEEMAANSMFSHTRPNGNSFYTVTDVPYMAENINCIAQLYLEQQSEILPNAAISSWSKSEGHRKNMLNSKLSAIGVGIAQGIGNGDLESFYCVQLFMYEGNTVTWVDNPILQTR